MLVVEVVDNGRLLENEKYGMNLITFLIKLRVLTFWNVFYMNQLIWQLTIDLIIFQWTNANNKWLLLAK